MSRILIFAVLIFLAAAVGVSTAETEAPSSKTKKFIEEEAAIVEPGILPNSFWYWADVFSEEAKFLFTVGRESKGEYLIKLAEERLAEMKALSEKGITKYAEQLLSKHEAYVQQAEKFYQATQKEGIEKVKEMQVDLEKEILKQEKELKGQAKVAPRKYEQARDKAIAEIGKWFKKILSKLSQKRSQILEEKAKYAE